MTIQTHTTDRKALAQAIAEALHTEYRYLRTPTYAYEVGGYSIGDFSVKNYENKGTTGEEIATQMALKELVGTNYAFAGVR